MYDLPRLRLLRELQHRGSLAAVAEALGYDPSSVSHQLTLLAREVGVPLLEPVGRRVRLTAAAETLVAHTEVILQELERAEAAIAASRDTVAGRVRVAAFQTASHGLIPAAARALATAHPLLEVRYSQVDAGDAVPGLLARDVDVAITERYPHDAVGPIEGVERTLSAEDELVLAAPRSFPAGLEALADSPWVLEPAGTAARAWAVDVCRSAGFEPRVRFESADLLLHARLVADGLAAAFLPTLGVPRPARARVAPTGHTREIAVSVRTGSASNPAILAVTTALAAALG